MKGEFSQSIPGEMSSQAIFDALYIVPGKLILLTELLIRTLLRTNIAR